MRNERLATWVASVLVILELVRWHSAVGAGVAVWVGARVAGAEWDVTWLYPMLIATLLSAAGNALNDAHDVAADHINRPTRPIPRGAMTVEQAREIGYNCVAVALMLALPFGAPTILGMIVGIALLLGYSTYLKPIPLVGNGIVGLLVGMCVGFGGLLAEDVAAVLLPGVAVGLLFGGREVLKTIYDQIGDQKMGIKTIVTHWGIDGALGVATLCLGLAVVILGLWAWQGQMAQRWIVPLVAAAVTASTLIPLWQHPSERHIVAWALQWSKTAGFAVLLAFLVVA